VTGRRTLAAAVATLLTSVSLYSVFSGQAWFWAGAGAIAVVACAGTLTRLRPLPASVCLAASACGLLAYLNVVFAAAHSWLLVVPAPSSLGFLWHLAGQGVAAAGRQAAPVTATPGLLLLATAGIGAVAAVTDLLAARLRSPAAAGLPLLALFGAPAATSASRGVLGTAVVFCLGAAGYLAVLSADGRERVRRWGRIVTPQRGGIPGTDSLAAAGRRTGLAAIVIALCVTLAVPGLHTSHVFGSSAAAGGPGLFPRPLAGMNADLRESRSEVVLTYHTANPEPEYLQMYVLSDLTATSWTMDPHLEAARLAASPGGLVLPAPPGLTTAGSGTVTTAISVSGTAAGRPGGLSFLPLPYPATRVQVPGRWSADPGTLMVFSPDAPLAGLDYTVTSKEPDPSAQQLNDAPPPPAAIRRQYLSVPASFRSLAPLARRVTRGAATAYGKALALQEWFTQSGQFSYSLDTPEPDDAAALKQFLTVTRRGYCQQFAFAMAVLARLLGIPSRVAVGFTSGTQAADGTWVVRTSDAHAWPELYFQGAGWLRFEPTPAGVGGQGTAYPPAYSIPPAGPAGPAGTGGTGTAAGGGQQGAGTPGASGGTARIPHVPADLGSGSGPGHGVPGGGSPAVPAAIAALALAAAASAPRVCRSLRRRRRWRLADSPPHAADAAGHGGTAAQADTAARPGTAEALRDARRAHAAWHEFLDDLTDYGMGHRPSESPRTTARRVSERLALPPSAAGALERIALAEERATYAGSPAPSGTLPGDVADVRRELAAAAGRWRRWRARLFPVSVLFPVRAAARRAAALTPRSGAGQPVTHQEAAGARGRSPGPGQQRARLTATGPPGR